MQIMNASAAPTINPNESVALIFLTKLAVRCSFAAVILLTTPTSLPIENPSDRVPLRRESVLPEAFPIKPSDNSPRNFPAPKSDEGRFGNQALF
jgi:hypothetical protein